MIQIGKILQIDFDGTIVEDKFPRIGKFMPEAVETLIDLRKAGYILLLNTNRTAHYLDEAVKHCELHSIEFDAVNDHFSGFATLFPEIEKLGERSRKLWYDYSIDDKDIKGFCGWRKVREILL